MMQRSKSLVLFLSATMVVGCSLWLGCAAGPEPRAGEEAAPLEQQVAVEAPQQSAPELLAQAEEFCKGGAYAEAALKLAELDAVRQQLTVEQKVRFERVRGVVRRADPEALPALDTRQKRARAMEHFEAGVEAYEKNDYVAASRCLRAADEFRVSLGWRKNRKLRKLRKEVDSVLDELETAYATGQLQYARRDYAAAKKTLQGVVDRGINIGAEKAEEVAALLAGIEKKLEEERQLEVQARVKHAAELLGSAKTLAGEKRYEEATALLTTLLELDAYLSDEQKAELQRLREEIGSATGILPGMAPEERAEKAEACYDAGMVAYRNKRYFEAQKHLDVAARLSADLSRRRNRKLEKVRAEISAELDALRAAYEAGKDAYGKADYGTAKRELTTVSDSAVSLGEDVERDVRQMLVDIDGKAAEQEVTEVQTYLARAGELEEHAAKVMKTRGEISAKLEAAQRSWQQEDFQTAKALFAEVQQLSAQPEVAGLPGVTETAGLAKQKLATVDKYIQISGIIADAAGLAESDLAAAESKLLQARELAQLEGMALLPGQRRICDELLAAIAVKYGPVHGLRREQCDGLEQVSEAYRQAGELDKAVQTLELLKAGSAQLVTARRKTRVQGKVDLLQTAAKERKTLTADVVKGLDRARQDLKGRQFQEALDVTAAVVQKAEESNLVGPAMAEVLKKSIALLEDDFEKAITSMSPEVKKMVDGQLAVVREEVARSVAEYYLAKQSPELAEPHLKSLSTGELRKPEYADWAKGRLQAIEQLKARAQQQRLLAVKGALKEVHELALQLDALAQEGQLEDARAVQLQLADARLELQVKKAELAVERGAYAEARKLLEEAPVEKASDSRVNKLYRPLVERTEMLVAAADGLQQVENALAAYEFETAAAGLAEVKPSDADPLVTRMEALADVLDSVRQAQEPEMRARSLKDAAVLTYRALLAETERRERAWQRYHGAVRAFVEGDSTRALPALSDIAANPAGLWAFEVANAQNIAAVLADAETAVIASAQSALDEAISSYDAGRYVEAASLLRKLQDMRGFTVSRDVQQEAARLKEVIQHKEDEAAQLYAQAVEAMEVGDRERVRSLVTQLRVRYKNTRVYGERL